ncbi:hypothetical protein LJC57_09780 [Parabacteroides sp. OttesenSCG-928-G07]|nr:hypothetical protein [Parabacteroides sp. OttesenSCG-928-G07]
MKIKNIFLSLLAVAAFAACSDNDEVVPQLKMVEASLSVGVNEDIVSKAETIEGTASENRIGNLTALVFNENGSLIAMKDTAAAAGASVNQIAHIKIQIADYAESETASSSKLQVVLIANAKDEVKNIKNVNDFSTILSKGIGEIANDALPMASKVIKIQGLQKDKENWVIEGTSTSYQQVGTTSHDFSDTDVASVYNEGGEVKMIRLVARIDLKGLRAQFADTYAGSTFTLDSIFLANVKNQSLFAGYEAADAVGYKRGAVPAFMPEAGGLIDPTPNAIVSALGKNYGVAISDGGSKTEAELGFSAYMFENITGSYTTRLIISGNIVTPTGVDLGKRYYHVPLKDTEGVRVLANTVYQVDVTINGIGSTIIDTIPKNAAIAAKVEVLDWILKEISHDFEEEIPTP